MGAEEVAMNEAEKTGFDGTGCGAGATTPDKPPC